MDWKVIQLNTNQSKWADYYLKNGRRLLDMLSNTAKFNTSTLPILIRRELIHKQRIDVLMRLHGRYYKLLRQSNFKTIEAIVNKTGDEPPETPRGV